MGLCRVGQRKRRTDDRTHLSRCPEAQKVLSRLADHVRTSLHQPSEVEPLHAHVTPDEERGVEGLPQPSGESNRHGDTKRAQQSDRIGEELSTDRIEDDVDRLDLGQSIVRHRLAGPEPERKFELFWRATTTAAVPTPPAAEWTRTLEPGWITTCRVSGIHAVR